MHRLFETLRPLLVILLAFMTVAVDFTSHLLSIVGDAFFVGALVILVWPCIKSRNDD